MDYELMRLECLRLATQQGLKGDEAIKAAERMMKFCKTQSLVDAAYGPDKIETPRATIHRNPPFSDYTPDKGE